VDAAQKSAAAVEANPYRNVIDPFSALIDAARQKINLDTWMEQEKVRQTQKGFQNALGDFHQDIIGDISGWKNEGIGGSIDVRNDSMKIIAEIKNKYNTVNSNSAKAIYGNLANHLQYAEKGYTAYLVSILPGNKKPINKQWSPNKKTMALRDDIRKIDGRSFYTLATGNPDSLQMLYGVLPNILKDMLKMNPELLKGTDEFKVLFEKAYGILK
jgi:hypothetical protein